MDNLFIGIIAGVFGGAVLGFNFAVENVEYNEIKGYHCTPITKHTGIKSAKAQVAKYQAMTRG